MFGNDNKDKGADNKPAETTDKATVSPEAKQAKSEAQEATGLYNVEYLVDHGNMKKGKSTQMHHSTAKALEFHKIVKIGEKVEVVKKEKR